MQTITSEHLIPPRVAVVPSFLEEHFEVERREVHNVLGLKWKYSFRDLVLNDRDRLRDGPYGKGYYPEGNVDFSLDDQTVLESTLKFVTERTPKDRIVIVEIGVCRDPYRKTSTSILIDQKRIDDIYVGIDVEDKSFLNDEVSNVHTLKTPSENFAAVQTLLDRLGVQEIDLLMIDGLHSINQVYTEWDLYTRFLSATGAVVFHDTNSHPGPYFALKSIDPDQYDIYKYLTDVQDWGIGVAFRKVA